MDFKSVGKRIKAAREAAGLTQEQLAEIVEMSPMHISVIERGVKPPKLLTFIRIANALNVSADELLQDCVDKSVSSHANRLSHVLEDLPTLEQRCLLNSLEAFIKTYNQAE